MTPTRLASSIAQQIDRLSKADKLPEPWDPGQLVELIEKYTQLIRAIDEGRPDPGQDQDIEEIFQHGRSGSYRDMVRRAQEQERLSSRKPTKRK
jgi:hypothetical protein